MKKKLLLVVTLTSVIPVAHAQEVKKENKNIVAQPCAQKVIEVPASGDTANIPSNAQLLDGIAATVFAQDGTRIITKSDLGRRSLDGQERSLEDLVYEQLMILDAQRFKIAPDDEQIDKHLASVQRDNNITLDQLKTIFTNAGYSYEEGREQFGIISLINQLLDFKIRSRLIVPEKEVVAYYNANPETQEATYLIQHALVPFDSSKTRAEQQADIERYVHGRNGFIVIDWQDPFWIEKSEIAENKNFIMSMQEGDISDPIETTEGFELFKLQESKPERVKTLEERYREISDALRRPKYEQLLNEYKKQLMDGASVLYLD